MRVLILANGDPPSPALMQRLAAEHTLLIATDGAANRAPALGVTPDVISGDFDSIEAHAARQAFPDAEFIATPDQDFADLEKALHLARERGTTAVTIVGAFGGRMDHTLGGIALLLRYAGELPLTLQDDQTTIRLISGTTGNNENRATPGQTNESANADDAETLVLTASPGDTISLFALDAATCVTATGVEWPLHDEPLAIGTRGVSNVAAEETVRIRARGGRLLVCHLPHARQE